jgi:hypothetical protein
MRVKRKRSKALVLLLLPALIFIGFVGWLICALEPPNRKATEENQASKTKGYSDGVSFIPAVYEDQTQAKNP